MDAIRTTFQILQAGTFAMCVCWIFIIVFLVIFLATMVTGVKMLSPLTDSIHQNLGSKDQDPADRPEALFLTGVVPGFLEMMMFTLELGGELGKFGKDGLIMDLWKFSSLVFKGCAEALVAVALLRLVLDTLHRV